jgi:hypothetical protein
MEGAGRDIILSYLEKASKGSDCGGDLQGYALKKISIIEKTMGLRSRVAWEFTAKRQGIVSLPAEEALMELSVETDVILDAFDRILSNNYEPPDNTPDSLLDLVAVWAFYTTTGWPSEMVQKFDIACLSLVQRVTLDACSFSVEGKAAYHADAVRRGKRKQGADTRELILDTYKTLKNKDGIDVTGENPTPFSRAAADIQHEIKKTKKGYLSQDNISRVLKELKFLGII